MIYKKYIKFSLLCCFLIFVSSGFFAGQNENEEMTYVESLFNFFKTGRVFELPDFPDTEVFREFLTAEARHKGITEDELKVIMKEAGITSYLLDLLKKQHISPVELANLLDLSWIQAFQMAYSSGAMELGDGSPDVLMGRESHIIKSLRQCKHITVKEIAYRSSVEDLFPLYAEIAYDPGLRNMPVVVYQHGDYPGTRFSIMIISI